MGEDFRKGVLVRQPFRRLSDDEVRAIDRASLMILEETGIVCFNEQAADIFSKHSCRVERNDQQSFKVKIPASVLRQAGFRQGVLGAGCNLKR